MVELPRFIIGVDPGYKSGVAILDLMFETCDGFEVTWEKYGLELEALIEKYRPAVVVEDFTINAGTVKKTDAKWSLWGIGVADHLARKYGCRYKMQTKSAAKRFATDAKLNALGWRVPGKGHLADAQRQTLLYVVENGWWHVLLD